jgi:hypothetical protein
VIADEEPERGERGEVSSSHFHLKEKEEEEMMKRKGGRRERRERGNRK